MGGALILLAHRQPPRCSSPTCRNRLVWSVLLVTIGFGAIGFLDDYLKISKKNSKGLPGKLKLAWQTLIVLAVYLIFLTDWNFQLEASWPFLTVGTFLDTHVTLPFVPTRRIDWNLGWVYVPFCSLVVVGTSNAVNLTDGLDGLAIGPLIVSATAFLVLAYVAGAHRRRRSTSPTTWTSRTSRAPRSWRSSAPPWPEPASASSGSTPTRPRSSWATWARWRSAARSACSPCSPRTSSPRPSWAASSWSRR